MQIAAVAVLMHYIMRSSGYSEIVHIDPININTHREHCEVEKDYQQNLERDSKLLFGHMYT